MKAYLYDFDKTICPGDCGSQFWLFCLKKRPWLIVFLPIQMIGGLCKVLKICEPLQRRCSIHSYVRGIDTESFVSEYCDKKIKTVFPYFHNRKRDLPTVVCSASPDFILKPICKKLEVEYLVCTEVDGKSGKILSKTCKGKEKVIRLNEKLEGFTYAEVYSDSEKHDLPILKLGEKAFLVTDGKVRELRL
ncbi:MAG: haloacid dehalogenase-like hydrolase [Clostridia bacterium]|nr:haloacid dehalogenase-like hydrolase [Clostridia bacterium]